MSRDERGHGAERDRGHLHFGFGVVGLFDCRVERTPDGPRCASVHDSSRHVRDPLGGQRRGEPDRRIPYRRSVSNGPSSVRCQVSGTTRRCSRCAGWRPMARDLGPDDAQDDGCAAAVLVPDTPAPYPRSASLSQDAVTILSRFVPGSPEEDGESTEDEIGRSERCAANPVDGCLGWAGEGRGRHVRPAAGRGHGRLLASRPYRGASALPLRINRRLGRPVRSLGNAATSDTLALRTLDVLLAELRDHSSARSEGHGSGRSRAQGIDDPPRRVGVRGVRASARRCTRGGRPPRPGGRRRPPVLARP